mgnify:CR=1 FL=1|jgi:hypothetical protein
MVASSPQHAATCKPSHLHVIMDGIHKKDSEIPTHIDTRRRNAHAFDPAEEHESASNYRTAPSSPEAPTCCDAWGPGVDIDDSDVARPEDICDLGCGEWELDDVEWCPEDAGVHSEATGNGVSGDSPACGALKSAEAWTERADESHESHESHELLVLLEDRATPQSEFNESAGSGIWCAGC